MATEDIFGIYNSHLLEWRDSRHRPTEPPLAGRDRPLHQRQHKVISASAIRFDTIRLVAEMSSGRTRPVSLTYSVVACLSGVIFSVLQFPSFHFQKHGSLSHLVSNPVKEFDCAALPEPAKPRVVPALMGSAPLS